MQSHVKMAGSDELDMDINSAIEEAWAEFSEPMHIDTAGRKDLYWMQVIALNSLVTDGEFFFQKHKDESTKFGIQIQEIDAMRIPPFATNRYRLEKQGETYKNGIIFNKMTGKPLYYALNRDNVNYYDMQPDRSTELIPAASMLHGFQQDAAGQARGVPLGQTSSRNALHDCEVFRGCTSERSVSEQQKSAFSHTAKTFRRKQNPKLMMMAILF